MEQKYTLIEKIKQNIGHGFGLSIIGLSIGLVGFTSIKAYQEIKATTYITVKGAAGIPVRSDLAVWDLTIHTQAKDLAQGNTTIGKNAQIVYDYLINAGVEPSEIKVEAVVPNPIYKKKYVQVTPNYAREEDTTEIISYDLQRTITVHSKRLDVISKAYDGISGLLSQGIELKIYKPSYRLSDIENKKLEALQHAIRNAYQRAQLFTGLDDHKKLELKTAHSSVFQITRPEDELSEYGCYDTTSIDKIARTVVTVTFKLS